MLPRGHDSSAISNVAMESQHRHARRRRLAGSWPPSLTMCGICQPPRHIEEMAHLYMSILGTALIAFFPKIAAAETVAPGASGIDGVIAVSPTRPGPIRKDEGPTVALVQNTQFVVKSGDAVVKTFTTDGEGRFQ